MQAVVRRRQVHLISVLPGPSPPAYNSSSQAEYFLSDVKAGAAKYCTGPAEKKAICKMKSLKIVKGKETAFTFSGSAGVATTDGQMNVMFDNIARQLDK